MLVGLSLQMLECKQSQVGNFSNSKAGNSNSSGPFRSIIKPIQNLIVTNKSIVTKFGADWFNPSHTMTSNDAPCLGNKPFENTVGKGEIAHNE